MRGARETNETLWDKIRKWFGKEGEPLLESTPEEIANMTMKELQDSLAEGWDFQNHNGRIHIRDENGNCRVHIDPPDKKTDYTHIHIQEPDWQLRQQRGTRKYC